MAPNTRSGVYSITHESGKRYIGSAVSLDRRWGEHRKTLRRGDHHSPRLQNAWNKYGEAAFAFNVLEECEVDRLIEREQWWMDAAQPEYNICQIAGSRLGQKASDETRRKLRESHMGKRKPHSEETRSKISNALMGHPGWNKGDHIAEETRRKVIETKWERRFERVGKKRKPHTEETRRKLSVAATAGWARRRAAKQGSQ